MPRWSLACACTALVLIVATALGEDGRQGGTDPAAEKDDPARLQVKTPGKHFDAGLVEVSVTEVTPAKGKGSKRKNTSTLKIKGRKRRLDQTPTMTTIYDAETKVTTFLFHGPRKTYRRLTAEQIQEEAAAARREGITLGPLPGKPTATGKTRQIAGQTAHAYRRDLGSGEIETLWAVQDFPHVAEIARLKADSQAEGDGRTVELPPGFVIRTESQAADGSRRVSHSAVRAEAVKDSEFEVPKGYEPEPEIERP